MVLKLKEAVLTTYEQNVLMMTFVIFWRCFRVHNKSNLCIKVPLIYSDVMTF